MAVQGEPIAIVGGTVVTEGVAGDLPGATVVIDKGRIISVGVNVRVPSGARVIDATGKIVTPGFINPASDNGLAQPSVYNEQPSTGDVPVADEIYLAFNPKNVDVTENPVDGDTAIVLVPSVVRSGVAQGKMFAGNAAVVDTSGSFDYLIKKDLGPVFSVSAGIAAGGRAATFPALERQLAEARDAIATAHARGSAPGNQPVKLKAEYEALKPVLTGDVPLLVEVDRASDILHILDIAREQRIKIVLLGAAEGWLVAKEIARANIPVIIAADANLPLDMDRLSSTYQNARRLAAAGVKMALAGEGIIGPAPRTGRSPRYVAGRAVAYGLDRKIALEAITIEPAKIYGFDSETGSIEVGKRADLVVWSGDPLEVTSFAEHVFVKGAEPSPPRAALLRDKYKALVDASSQHSVASPSIEAGSR